MKQKKEHPGRARIVFFRKRKKAPFPRPCEREAVPHLDARNGTGAGKETADGMGDLRRKAAEERCLPVRERPAASAGERV
ncbi:MAG: hypothetical protein C6P37_14930 [Caldibacillus debilis]|uniref:Uncharacterized protein n=1 Tax=Caldibacillus debilis TaxID=301148 RepID=A0A3E0JY25_9BACI|nr:MAG: hypothetical protein BAA03_09635 [Caldibacillus debilis]REJ25195.1 MAG: hypothetical protein C6P37_14930 [Caldibacillus debilis]